MNLKRVNEIRARCHAATQKPWTVVHDEYGLRIPQVSAMVEGCVGSLKPYHAEDAEFIAQARTDLEDLLYAYERTLEALKEISKISTIGVENVGKELGACVHAQMVSRHAIEFLNAVPY